MFPTVPACGWLGLAYIGFPQKSWINGVGAFRTSTIAHEMGHNFGLLHAATDSWTIPILLLMSTVIPFTWAGLRVSRPVYVDDELATE